MALTLPYPDLDFVPLDVLTAEQMNQIVSNYTFIAAQFPLGTSALADSSVSVEKVAWSTMKMPCFGKVVNRYDNIQGAIVTYTMTASGWLAGTCNAFEAGALARVEIFDSASSTWFPVAGVSHMQPVQNNQFNWFIPVAKGQEVRLHCNSNAATITGIALFDFAWSPAN